ncbi:serine protease 27-like isoform X2 [Heterodontus francisci]|uniref:serine protease 27-like isoform X2 n=1 Tax=Heterodontus francisci TaxID=7792 RepID=UPI00355BEA07
MLPELRAFLWGQADQACGRPVISNRIVGGQDSMAGSWPWQVSIHEGSSHICGGTLITNTWVLTAAHCVSQRKIRSYTVYAGRYQQGGVNNNERSSTVQSVIRHVKYQEDKNDYDIALVKLMKTIPYSDYILPICLPNSRFQISCGSECWVTGWGNVQESVSLPSPGTLQEVAVDLIGRQTCNLLYQRGVTSTSDITTISDKMLCAGLPQGTKDACQGDSGGPLVYLNNNTWVQVGIVSFGESCGLADRPGVYTDVAAFQTWITGNVGRLQLVSPTATEPPSPDGCRSGSPGGVRGALRHVGSLVSLLLCLLLLAE